MKIWPSFYLIVFASTIFLTSCGSLPFRNNDRARSPVDTVGFARYGWQMDSIMQRIKRLQEDKIFDTPQFSEAAKTVICPHDDYAYASYLYPAVLQNVKASTLFLIGVAHKAKLLNLQDQIVFGSYRHWKGPYGNVKISALRDVIVRSFPEGIAVVSDSMMTMEHSLEALVPFLQYYNRDIEIVPILVPYMSYERMSVIAEILSEAIGREAREHDLKWGKDFAIVISTDAVHYGDEDWGNSNFSYYGTDSAGYWQALNHESEIISTLTGQPNPESIKHFTAFTVEKDDYKQYKWTWCGRYSVPFGMLTAYYLTEDMNETGYNGYLVGYANSIDHPKLPVEDLGMGVTAPAGMHHWVGYAGIVYF